MHGFGDISFSKTSLAGRPLILRFVRYLRKYSAPRFARSARNEFKLIWRFLDPEGGLFIPNSGSSYYVGYTSNIGSDLKIKVRILAEKNDTKIH